MNYYYILIDKVNKTLQFVLAESCQVATEKKIEKILNLPCRLILQKRYTLFFNETNSKVDYNSLYKYARKFKLLDGIL